MPAKKPVIALVEDNPADAKMLQYALDRTGEPVDVVVLPDGRQALDYLISQAGCDLVVLDLNLPGLNGFEVLAKMKANPALRKIPVVVLSSSGSREDIERSYFEGASSYICKPHELKDILAMAASFAAFWLCVAKLPASRRNPAEQATSV